jgi:hypothetical protein
VDECGKDWALRLALLGVRILLDAVARATVVESHTLQTVSYRICGEY